MADTDVAALPQVLHFDPDATTRRVTSTGLRLEGFGVTDVDSLEAALTAFEANAPDALVIDCSDKEAAERLTNEARDREIPVVLLTARDNRVPFEAAQVLPCMVRPFATPALCRVLYPLVGGRRPSSSQVTPIRGTRTSEDDIVVAIPEQVMVGDYQLITEIARGGMGTVYLARRSRDVGVSRCYALKLLHPHLANQPNFVSMLHDEAALASRINHQNVAAVCDVGKDGDDQHYIVMDYVEGLALSKLMKRKSRDIPIGVIASVFVDALEGLYAAHTVTDADGHPLELVHRDVSPENILIGTDGAARLADFGVAKARIRLTHTVGDVRKGKLAYLAPEQLIDDDTVDGRVDIWAAGGSLWTALTGKQLFTRDADSEVKIMRNILEMEIPPPSTIGRKPDSFLDEIVMKALSRNPSDRYGSAREMSEAIRKAAMKAGLLASRAEVGAFVMSACRSEVEARRNATQNALASLDGERISSEEFHQATVVSSPTTQASNNPHEETRPEGNLTMVDEDPPPRRRWGLVAILLLGVGTAGWMFMNRDQRDDTTAKANNPRPPANAAAASAPPSKPADASPSGVGSSPAADADSSDPAQAVAESSEEVAATAPPDGDESAPPVEDDPEVNEDGTEEEDEVVVEDDPAEPRSRKKKRRRPTGTPTPKPEPAKPEPEPEPEPAPEPAPTPASTKKDKPKNDVLSEANPYR